ncbi:non-ribosomal peptide synthetase, partial [Azoarcus indigens]|uniref:non-ribosomal peptide synthetase n=1 Tax=Azoarcus indigens TaxID=29545 RepID=UPI00106130A2
RIEAAVPGGAANIQDIYPLAPLQEGILFHHLLQQEGDAYVTTFELGCDSRERLEGFIASLNHAIGRHDILRTAVHWEGLREPVQVVHRQAEVRLQWLEAGEGEEARAQLEAHVAPGRYRIDVRQAPLIHALAIKDEAQQRWLLALPCHHLISDHTTLELLVGEIALIQEGRQAGLPEPVPFRRFVAQAKRGVSVAEHEAFFTRLLGDVDEPTAPFGLLDIQGDGSGIEEARLPLESALASALRAQARQHGVSAASLFHLAWALVLGKTTGRDDVVFGTVLFGRMQGGAQADKALGLFINTLPMRVRLGTDTVQASLSQTHQILTELLHHEHASLALAQRCSGLPGGTPLFSALLNYRHSPQRMGDGVPMLEGLQALSGEERTNYPVTMSVDDLGAGFELVAQAGPEAGAQRLCAYMHAAVSAVVAALQNTRAAPVCELALLGERERAQLMTWGENRERYAGAQPIHRLIEAQAAARPDAVAVIFGEAQLSYGELNQRANQLAHHLTGRGVGPEVKVGIAVERSLEMVVGLLAILKAGGAYVPLDPEYPAERLGYMTEDSGIGLLLTQRALRAQLPLPGGLAVLELDTLALTAEPAHNPDVPLSGENLAYVIYTSGSTGRPKGAANRHHALYNRLKWMQDAYRLNAQDTVLQKTPFSFDVSVWEFFWPLMVGARLVVAAPGEHREPARLVERIVRHQVTTLHFVPSMLQAFLAHEGIEACTSLRRIVCSGEALPAEALQGVFARLPQAALYNLYGPTEAAIDVTHWTCRGDGRSLVPIGAPISGIRTHVLDGELNLTPAGVAGELYLGGVGLARGYLNRPGLSAERFIADPYDEAGGRLYRTGDLVRWNAEGELEYLGRIDHQVKIRGFRIELGEVEAQLLAQPEVREAVVVADEGPGGARLVGYVSAQAGAEIDTAELRTKLGEQLPDYMVPSVLMVLDSLPLNANGKIDRKALPKAEAGSSQDYEAPQGEVEERLAAIWAEVLGVERVGRQDSFFELGGHSLLALKLLERMRTQGLPASVKRLFQHPQLAAFAAALESEPQPAEVAVPPNRIPADCAAITPEMLTLVTLDREEIGRIEAAVPGGAANIQDIYPLAPLQEGMLFHHLAQQQGDAYVTQNLLAFDRRERLESFVSSLNQAIQRHDILRTTMLWEGLHEPVQVVHRQAEVRLQWLEAAEGEDARSLLEARVAPGRYRIDVRQAPLIHALAAHDLPQGRWLLCLPCHHLILDHSTLELLVGEIALIQQGREAELPEPVPFRRFVAQARLGVSAAEHERFFTRLLGDVAEPTAPFGLLDIQGDGSAIEAARLALEPSLALAIRSQARRYGVSAASLFHLAWALVLGKTTGRDDVVFGTVLFGRMQGGAQADKALGLFINTLPMRVRLGTDTVQASLSQTHQTLTELLHHEHASLALAQRCSGLPGGTPLFSALLNYRHSPQGEQAQGTAWEGLEVLSGEERTNYPLGVSVNDLGEGFQLVAQAVPEAGAQRLCAYLHAAVSAVVAALQDASATPVCELALLGQRERAQLMAWGENRERYAGAQPIHRLIEWQAVERPDAAAVILGEASLSYGELNRRANLLAHHLIGLGVGPEVKVGIAVERSLELVVGLLAILKAGGAYVPLDPEYPAERLGYMMEDSGIALLLTQSAVRAQLPVSTGLAVLALDTLALPREPEHKPGVAVSGENLAYVIYTSGSTGRPKGVAVTHGPLSMHCQETAILYEMGPASRELHFLSFSFDGAHERLLTALSCGAALVLRDASLWPAQQTLTALQQHRISNAGFPAAYLRRLAEQGAERGMPPPVRLYSFGGEAMPREGFENIRHTLKPELLINGYGPTEAVVTPLVWKVAGSRACSSAYAPIGRPVGDRKAYVLDTGLNLAPAGIAGELYLGGVGLARGYLNRPGLSAERFIADPY